MEILEPATFLGLGAVAIWLYMRFPGLRPRTITRAIVHVGVSFGLFNLIPYLIAPCAKLPAGLGLPVYVAGVMLPTLGYVLLSWLWLMAKIHDLSNSKPRGGHRVRLPRRAAGSTV